VRDRPILSFKLSTRLRHVLEPSIRVIGELHGRRYAELLKWRSCGKRTMAELQNLVKRLQVDSGEIHLPPEPDSDSLLAVPAQARDLNLDDLPLPTRLSGVLQKCGYQTLGDLDKVDAQDLREQKNCGPSTITKLQEIIHRAGTGEFAAPKKKDLLSNIREMAAAIDMGFDRLSARDRKIYKARLFGGSGGPRTLHDIGLEYDMTRERVRQIANEATEKIRRGAGPRLGQSLENILAECQKRNDVLTPDQLEQWLGKNTLTQAAKFYVGVLYEMGCFVTAGDGPAE
jgi:hypothetical protein